MRRSKTPSAALAALLLTTACSGAAIDRKLDEKLAREPAVKTRTELQRQSLQAIQAMQGLTADQRTRLLALRERAIQDSTELRERSLRLQGVLVEDLLSGSADSGEVALIKRKLAEVEQDRLSVFFRSVADANRILGRWGSEREQSRADFDDMMIDWVDFHAI